MDCSCSGLQDSEAASHLDTGGLIIADLDSAESPTIGRPDATPDQIAAAAIIAAVPIGVSAIGVSAIAIRSVKAKP
jgi:hypothetical protein